MCDLTYPLFRAWVWRLWVDGRARPWSQAVRPTISQDAHTTLKCRQPQKCFVPSMDYGESATWVYWLGPKIGTGGLRKSPSKHHGAQSDDIMNFRMTA